MPLLKCSAGKSKPQSAIRYITNPKKAEVISVRNLFEDEDYAKQFEDTAALYGKGKDFNERKYYHFKLSCARQDNLTPQGNVILGTELQLLTRKRIYGIYDYVTVNGIGIRMRG